MVWSTSVGTRLRPLDDPADTTRAPRELGSGDRPLVRSHDDILQMIPGTCNLHVGHKITTDAQTADARCTCRSTGSRDP